MFTRRSTRRASYATAGCAGLTARSGAPRRSTSAVHRHYSLLQELGEDAGGVQALQAADGVEILEGDPAVDLRQHEPGPGIEVQPDDLVRGQDDAGDAIHRAQLALVHLGEVLLASRMELLRLLILRLAGEDLPEQLHRPGEVVQRHQLARSGVPGRQLLVLAAGHGQRFLVDGPCAARLGLGARRRSVLLDGHGGTVVPRALLRPRLGLLRRQRLGRRLDARLARRFRRHLLLRGGRREPRMRRLLRGRRRGHVRMDALQRAAQELARAQVGRLQRVGLLPGAHRLQHAALAVVIEPLEEEAGELVLLGRGHVHERSPRGATSPRSTAPRSAPSMSSRRSRLARRPALSFCCTCSRARLKAASARCIGSLPSPFAAVCWRRGHSSSNCLKISSARALCFWNSGCSFCPSIHSSLALAAVLISSSVRPELAVTVMLWRRPVFTSSAETETMPSALMSKMTSMSTSPRLALRSPVNMNSPSSSFWVAISLSPCSTVIFAEVWSSFTVVKTW